MKTTVHPSIVATFLLAAALAQEPADRAAPRTDENSMIAHAQLVEKAKQGRIDLYFAGDSIVRRWGALDYPHLLDNWKSNFFGWNAGNFGWGADRTQNVLWRLENGELDGVNPKVIVLLAGTNNVGNEPRDEQTVAEIVRGMKATVDLCRQKAPNATIVLTAIFRGTTTWPSCRRSIESTSSWSGSRTAAAFVSSISTISWRIRKDGCSTAS